MHFSFLQTYHLGEVAALAGVAGGLIIGAGAGSRKVVGVNCEVRVTFHILCVHTFSHSHTTQMMPNVRVPHDTDPGINNSHIAKVTPEVRLSAGVPSPSKPPSHLPTSLSQPSSTLVMFTSTIFV